jgi:heme-degrading monooxygenase HmoA
MPLVAITRLRVRSWRYLPAFLLQSFRAERQAKAAPGNLAADELADGDRTFWTRSMWTDAAAMRAFVIAPPHRNIMPRLIEWCDEAAFVQWAQESAELPSWQEAHRRLMKEGRRSRVAHPSGRQDKFEFPPPRAA